ncbi:hypothetical protein ZWY2020_057496 [Hordeum vulgare]|nr:hypothetical protein ZWY2020_057496 [Hordeum vulgare]
MDASYRRSGAGGGGGSAPRTVEDIFKDYRARRNAIHRALTHDVEEFYAQCDPGEARRDLSLSATVSI